MAVIIEGVKAEKEGLKASEKSDAAVRDAADKVLHISDKAAHKADHKTGGLFSNIGNWLRDRLVVQTVIIEFAGK